MVDTDDSGQISRQEFAHWWSETQLATTGSIDSNMLAEMQEIWDQADADGSGELDKREFETVLAKLASSAWKRVRDEATGRTYFYHTKTKETRWVLSDSASRVQISYENRALYKKAT